VAVVVSNGCGMLANTGVLITAAALRKRQLSLQPEERPELEPAIPGDTP
jgi:hypothetical protein